MSLTRSTFMKIKGPPSASRKTAQHFFDYTPIWNEKELTKAHEECEKTRPPHNNGDGYSRDYYVGEALTVLEKAGFKKIVDTVVWNVSYTTRPERYIIWAHPCGVLCSASTYNYDANVPAEHHRINNMHINSHINTGFSYMGYHTTFWLSSSSGSGHVGKTGESHAARSKSISTSYDLIRELIDIQTVGRIVPFHEQNMGEISIYLPEQIFIPLSMWKDDFSNPNRVVSQSEMFEHIRKHANHYGEAFWGNLFANAQKWNTIIPCLGDVMAVSQYHHAAGSKSKTLNEHKEGRAELSVSIAVAAEKFGIQQNYGNARSEHTAHLLGPHINPNTVLHYIHIEGAGSFIGRIQEHTQKRYLSSEDAELIETWMHALKHHKTGVDWANIDTDRITSDGISIVHLCVALDAERYIGRAQTEGKALTQEAFEHTSPQTLKKLCTTVLPDGNTLPLMILDEYLNMLMQYSATNKILYNKLMDIFKDLHTKVPARSWNCSINCNTVDGMWLYKLYRNYQKSHNSFPRKTLLDVVEPLKEWGCNFAQHTSIALPLRRLSTDERKYASAAKLEQPNLESAFFQLMEWDQPDEETRQKMLKNVMNEVAAGSRAPSRSRRL